MSRPLLELADLVRTAGVAFLWRSRRWIRWTHIKVLLPQSALPTVSDGYSGTVDRRASKRTSSHALPPCGLHPTP
jgi:hypothetical protein